MAPVNVIEISSDEEDNTMKKAGNSSQVGGISIQNRIDKSKSSNLSTLSNDGQSLNARGTPDGRHSTCSLTTQVNYETPQKRALSEPGTSTTAAVYPVHNPASSLHNLRENRPSGACDYGTISTIASNPEPTVLPPKVVAIRSPTQQQSNPHHKRKPTTQAESAVRKRARPDPGRMVSIRPTQQSSSAPAMCNVNLWSIPQYQEPNAIHANTPSDSSAARNATDDDTRKKSISRTKTAFSKTPSATHSPSLNSDEISSSTPSPPRPRRTMWTCAQLANFATALDIAFDVEAFAVANYKTPQQVKETLGFLVMKPIFEYAEEGQKIARKFHREMKQHRVEVEKLMKKVHRRERKAGHWAAEGMPVDDKDKVKAKKKGMEKKTNEDEGRGGRKGKKGVLEQALSGEKTMGS